MREANEVNQEEVEETSFVPSAISVRQEPLVRRDNQCSEKTPQLLTVRVGGDKGRSGIIHEEDEPLTKWQWCEFVENKAHRGRLWNMMGKEHYIREMWECYCQERLRVFKKIREDAEKERQAGIQGQWQHE